MTARLRAPLGLGLAALSAAALAPATAAAAAGVPPLSALTDRDGTGATRPVAGRPGELVAPVLGVANLSGAPVKGAAVQIRVIEGLDLPRTFANCQYFVDSNLEGAWCQFDEELAAGGTYAMPDFRVAVAPDAIRADSIVFRWVTPEQVAAGGGIEALAKRDSRTDESAAGTQGPLRLEPRQLPLPAAPHPIGFASVRVTAPSPTQTTPAPPATATPVPPTEGSPQPSAPPTAAATPPADGGGAGELPVTGSATTTAAGLGIVLLITGGVGYLVARRRRIRFQS
ncbi:MAG TPA: LPXTG cell wall anchor domain-containing protein [Pilimelia sp.]|nr:LPXTG cell wall anchor domain-containing protein [Pilimelia sp.]